MFKAFSERIDPKTQRRMFASAAVSVFLYGGLGTAVVVAASNVPELVLEEKKPQADVTFFKQLPPPAPKPPPPAPKPLPAVATPTPPAPAPAPAPASKLKPQPKAPKEIPTNKPKESDPAPPGPAPEPAEYATGPVGFGDADATGTSTDPDASGTGTGTGNGPPDATGTGGPSAVILPAGATPPERIGALVTADDYPKGALSARLEGTVVVKVIIQVDGTVDLVKFIQRDPTFDEAVLGILKRIRFKPAIYNGQAIAVYQNLRFPFSIDE